MGITDNQRPGVYSRYDITSLTIAPRSDRDAAVVAKAGEGEEAATLTSLAGLETAFPADSALKNCAKLLLQSGVTRVVGVPAAGDYKAALEGVANTANIGAVVCDAQTEEDLAALRDCVSASAEAGLERLAFCGLDDAEAAAERAEHLNSERVILCCPAVTISGGEASGAVYAAAALAGKILSQNDSGYNFSGEPFSLIESPVRLEENVVQNLIRSGVSVIEQRGANVECVRVVTTRTKTSGETDYSLRGINAILIIDQVMAELRSTMSAMLRGARVTTASLQSIQTQAAIVLSGHVDGGLLESFETPRVTLDSADPTVCLVELRFRIAHVVSQIHVSAQIRV